jgi:hypothetical protein
MGFGFFWNFLEWKILWGFFFFFSSKMRQTKPKVLGKEGLTHRWVVIYFCSITSNFVFLNIFRIIQTFILIFFFFEKVQNQKPYNLRKNQEFYKRLFDKFLEFFRTMIISELVQNLWYLPNIGLDSQ